MLCGVKVPGGMLVLGGVAASDVATGETQPEVDPIISDFEAVFTPLSAGCDLVNMFQVSALGHLVPG